MPHYLNLRPVRIVLFVVRKATFKRNILDAKKYTTSTMVAIKRLFHWLYGNIYNTYSPLYYNYSVNTARNEGMHKSMENYLVS